MGCNVRGLWAAAWLLLTALLVTVACSVPKPTFTDGGAGNAGDALKLPCEADADCAEYPSTRVCDTEKKTCVECLPGAEGEKARCGAGLYCSAAKTCQVGCGSAEDCGKLDCDPKSHTCTGCSEDRQCPLGTLCKEGACLPGCSADRGCPSDAWQCCDTKCRNLFSDAAHCGACAAQCELDSAIPSCVNGACSVGSCEEGRADCDEEAANGCETDTTTSAENCGGCGTRCPRDKPFCIDGECSQPVCGKGFEDCKPAGDGVCETEVRSDPANCGACGVVCGVSHATSVCETGKCRVLECDAGFADCNGKPLDGCEANLSGDAANCGACGSVCENAHGSTQCAARKGASPVCRPTCAQGWDDCDGQPKNGCETNTAESLDNCGLCDNPCRPANADGACQAGSCVIAACKPGFADCNGDPEDGCEAELAKDALNCDGCGNACPSTNGKPSCVEKTCQIACTAGFSDCDDLVGNGCEIDTQSNVLNCGACGKACPAVGGEPNCVKGVCGVSTCASGRADCDADKFLNGCEIDINNDPKNCGGCGLACVVENGTPGCVGGVCTVTKCDAGWADCNKDYSDGCEARLDTVTNCGACGAACDLPNAAETCASGTCGVQLCLGSYRDCDGEAANGCETNTADDASNCGICDNVCSDRNGEPVCRSGICGIVCDPSYGNCNQDAGDGCETSLSTSTKHCGVCGNACTAAHGTAMCLAGTCAVSDCDLNFADCDRAYVSGCESDTTQDLKNCGGCGRACSTNHGTPNCAAGACQITCATGYGDCSGGALDGCETDLRTNTRHCGACGNACSFANATASCVTSSCALGTCSTGYGNCDANDVNGCETNTLTAPLHCGGCGKKCNLANANAGCSGGSCTIASCKGSFQDCNGLTADGCESNLAVDELNCGSCGSVCEILHGTPNCVNGGCEVGTCDEGWEDCNGDPADGCETNVTSSVSNCGTCGNICPSATGTPNCVSGVCGVSSCSAGLGNCDGVGGCEANLKTDANNCGACGKVCAVTNGTGVCSNGTCAVDACAPGFDDCDGVYSNGCERSLTTLTDCGGCDVACALSNAAESCATGSCRIASCAAGFADCDSSPGNGCEVNTKTNTSHCGGCGAACSSTNGTASCSNGACGITCSAGYGNCNGSVSDGCEARLNTTTNCGSCGNTCSAANGAPSCTGTPLSCGIASCNTGYGNCDALTGNGCETDLRSNSAHCGGCGQACSSTNGSASCSNGSCSISCSSGYGNCDGSAGNGCEVSLLSDPDHCNSCSIACAYPNASAVCTSGKCGLGACQGSSRDCNGVATDGCERDVATDVTNCGSCGSSCTNANGGATCSSGNCSFSCNSGYKACDANPTNGCETDVRTITNCGTCGNACSYSNATAKCNAGTSCAIDSCDYLWGNCDNSSGNGCEKSLSGDAVNCGACGRTCSANHGSASCSGGACSITCDSGYGNCNGDAQKDGCEVNLASNKSHCGACNAVCSTECRGGACCVNLGAQNTPTTVRADRCLIVYPIQGATVRVQVHSLTAGPIPFTWTNGCGQSGSGTFSASWSSEPFPLCSPVVVDLAGPATDTGFQWWFEG